ncbi:hypothetical protein FA13DRAFT_1771115 [Coprinellus micaceus]|uniref:Uncharacterized protein n=1 Tax=Coprinellus micaceus TaxID=71717 RepID=A0A4Y7TQL7_COPMI|nr:hypothetical protein FA13DRAFT_1771115 [Coprinellus micaceus]
MMLRVSRSLLESNDINGRGSRKYPTAPRCPFPSWRVYHRTHAFPASSTSSIGVSMASSGFRRQSGRVGWTDGISHPGRHVDVDTGHRGSPGRRRTGRNPRVHRTIGDKKSQSVSQPVSPSRRRSREGLRTLDTSRESRAVLPPLNSGLLTQPVRDGIRGRNGMGVERIGTKREGEEEQDVPRPDKSRKRDSRDETALNRASQEGDRSLPRKPRKQDTRGGSTTEARQKREKKARPGPMRERAVARSRPSALDRRVVKQGNLPAKIGRRDMLCHGKINELLAQRVLGREEEKSHRCRMRFYDGNGTVALDSQRSGSREKLRSGGPKEASMKSGLQRRMGGAVRENADAEAGRRRRDGRAVGMDQIVHTEMPFRLFAKKEEDAEESDQRKRDGHPSTTWWPFTPRSPLQPTRNHGHGLVPHLRTPPRRPLALRPTAPSPCRPQPGPSRFPSYHGYSYYDTYESESDSQESYCADEHGDEGVFYHEIADVPTLSYTANGDYSRIVAWASSVVPGAPADPAHHTPSFRVRLNADPLFVPRIPTTKRRLLPRLLPVADQLSETPIAHQNHLPLHPPSPGPPQRIRPPAPRSRPLLHPHPPNQIVKTLPPPRHLPPPPHRLLLLEQRLRPLLPHRQHRPGLERTRNARERRRRRRCLPRPGPQLGRTPESHAQRSPVAYREEAQ